MQLGMVGLGRMGANLVRRLLRGGHDCVVYDREPEPGRQLAAEGATPVDGLAALVAALAPPRHLWLMLPAGAATASTLATLAPLLAPGDLVVDGGNGHFRDAVRRAEALAARGLHFLDVGTSGGVWGLSRGYCLMIGGAAQAVQRMEPVFATLAPGAATDGRPEQRGYLHAGPAGAGHFLKMVHNGIEYGLMQAYAEGFDLLRAADEPNDAGDPRYPFELDRVAELWRHGSVVSSWLLDLTAAALAGDASLDGLSGQVGDSGEGRWAVHAAVDRAVPVPVLTAALEARFRSRGRGQFADRLLSVMRRGFGGHREPEAE